jgi:hypothetical protein
MEDKRTHLCLTLAADESAYLFRRGFPGKFVEIYNAGRPDGRPTALRIGITAPISIRVSRAAGDMDFTVSHGDAGNLCLTLSAFQTVYLWEEGAEDDSESVEVMVRDEKTHRVVVSAPQSWRIFRHPRSEHDEIVTEKTGTQQAELHS